jgi:hypothetical protein
VTGAKVHWDIHAFGCRFPMKMAGLSARIVIANWFIKIIRRPTKSGMIQFDLNFLSQFVVKLVDLI